MTDFDRNTRTLIICFVLAVVVLVPLVIVESSWNMEPKSNILGEMKNIEIEEKNNNLLLDKEMMGIVLPDAGD